MESNLAAVESSWKNAFGPNWGPGNFRDTPTTMSAILEQGKIGEEALNEWLSAAGFSYVAVCQAKETFAELFSGAAKRPDFLVLLESIGVIAVDAKNYTLSQGSYSIELEDELRKAVAFERLFRMPIWYAYYDKTDGVVSWYWISALKAFEVGKHRVNKTTGQEFLAISREHFEKVLVAADIAKLFTHRLPAISRIAGLPLG